MAYNGEAPARSAGPAGVNGPPQFTWDSGAFAVPGTYEEIIKNDTVQPKLKHWYKGDFPGALAGTNWRIKTMDKPKIDIESVEQLRFNVKRNYPVKYNFGDLSITFWDDIYHDTITSVSNYFQDRVWVHPVKQLTGMFMLRDSIVIPKFKITEYSTEDSSPIVFTYYNSVLSSFDFDAVDDEGDEAVHTIQLVLKVEGYTLKK